MTASKASPSSARRRAFQATKRRAGKNAHSRSKRGTLATLDRERPWVHGTMLLTCSRGSCSLCEICSKQHLTSAMMQTVTDCLILCKRWRQSTCHLTGLARSPLRANHSKPPAASAGEQGHRATAEEREQRACRWLHPKHRRRRQGVGHSRRRNGAQARTRTAGANAARWQRWGARERSRFRHTAPCP